MIVCQFLHICGFLCQLVQWPSGCNVYKAICLECRVAKSGIRISLFYSSSYVLHSRLLRNLIVSWHLIPTLQTAFDVTQTIQNPPQDVKERLCPHFSIACYFYSCLGLVTVTSVSFVELTREAGEAPSHSPVCSVEKVIR